MRISQRFIEVLTGFCESVCRILIFIIRMSETFLDQTPFDKPFIQLMERGETYQPTLCVQVVELLDE
jgi:hypothetical protein